MFIKLLGAVCIIFSGVMLGMYWSRKEEIRMKELECVKKALLLLKSQIDYCSEPLPEALHNIAFRSEVPIKHIFEKISLELKQKKGQSINEIWVKQFNLYSNNTNFSKEDLEAIKQFGKALGYLDKQLQINNIDILVEYIDRTIKLIIRKNQKEGKMYQSLGILGGMLLALLLM